jgi:hypothetical protein
MSMLQFTAEELRMVEFGDRCWRLGPYLHRGKRVTMTEQQLRHYGVTPHQVISELLNWVNAEEAEEVWETKRDEPQCGESYCRARTFIVYCTKQGDKYVFKAKVKA